MRYEHDFAEPAVSGGVVGDRACAGFAALSGSSLAELPAQLVSSLTSLPFGDYGILPIITALDFGFGPEMANMKMIWFGIIVVVVLEMGMISPPVGLNVFVVKSIAPGVSMRTIFRGIWRFWFAMALMLLLLTMFPQNSMFLPLQMVG